MRLSNLFRPSVLVLAIAASVACSPSRYAMRAVADGLSDDSEGGPFARDDDPQLVSQAVPFGLKTMESLADKLPDHVGLQLAMARGFTQYGFAFVQQPSEMAKDQDPDRLKADQARATRLYLRAREHGLRALELVRGIQEAQLAGPEEGRSKALATLQKEDVPLLYWTLVPWAAAMALNKRTDFPFAGDVPAVAAMLDRALALDEAWAAGALHEFAMSFDSARPEGTTPEKEKQHFERAQQLAANLKISPLVSYAESVLGPAQDKAGFEKLLNQALAFDVDQPQARKNRLANVLGRRRAQWLLAHEADIIAAGWRFGAALAIR